MSKKVIVYQTLKNKGNPTEVESEGPFLCNWLNAWLGDGFYFWSSFISNAHWWGQNHCENNYFICEATCVTTDENCFDLVGDTDHLQMFGEAVAEMRNQGLLNQHTTVSRVIQFLRNQGVFKFEATRAVGYASIGEGKKNKKFLKRMLFEAPKVGKREQYLQFAPPIQICFYEKQSLNLKDFKIIFPDEYIDSYVL